MRGSGRFLTAGVLLPLFFLLLTVIYTAAAFDIRAQFSGDGEIGPRTIPLLAAVCMYAALLWVIVQELRKPPEDPVADEEAGEGGLLRPLGVTVATAAYILLFAPLGYVISTLLFVAALFAIFQFETRRPLRFVLAAAGVTAVFYGLFAGIFGVRLPGLLGGLL
ncbi:tripartite tricarboxylate transporter TctB family protein [Oceanicella sp. SM1341]|uniref:tripartite tricarboxylate transporter TctB family protein n=1 Tax=Oceanicella sp. SM1341 TaxID=1548889 RepID=UPI000E4D97AC|nr:tripartite tricarboxylate transporter TctB family protein [Oceanicella sp. SM1341]